MNFSIKKYTSGLLDNSFEILPILYYLGELAPVQFGITPLIPPYFGTFSDIDISREFIPDQIWNSCIFLNDFFKWFFIWYIYSVNILIAFVSSVTVFSSSLLFLTIVCYLSWISFSMIDIITVKEAWLDKLLNSDRIWLKKYKVDNWVSIIRIISILSENLIDKSRKFQIK